MSSESNEKKKSWAAGASAMGALGAAVAGAACCVGPLVVAILGVGGAGAMVALAPYRPYFMAGTAVMLGVGFFLVYRRRPAPAATGDACGCDEPAPKRKRDLAKVMLWVATLLVVGFTVSPYVIGAVADASDDRGETAVAHTDARRVQLSVAGMDCAACGVGIQRAMEPVGPYRDFELDLEAGTVSFAYDGDEDTAGRFASAIREIGYEVGEPAFP
ncbi:MAG TPA: hypothetical protein DEF51_48135 [Myxococcales bacterium]|nr:hypothetical protein [Myxococcales bacterium]